MMPAKPNLASPTTAPADLVGPLARQQTAVLVSILGARISRGATAYYRANWDMGLVEWRLMMTLNTIAALNVSELSQAADVDKAATSRGLGLLQDRGLVTVAQTRTRGRAAIASLTSEGRMLVDKLAHASHAREARLFAGFSADEKTQLDVLLLRLAEALESDDWRF